MGTTVQDVVEEAIANAQNLEIDNPDYEVVVEGPEGTDSIHAVRWEHQERRMVLELEI